MARDELDFQASSLASKVDFSATRFKSESIYIYSLVADNLDMSILFRDWFNSGRSNYGHPHLTTKFETKGDEIMQDLVMTTLKLGGNI